MNARDKTSAHRRVQFIVLFITLYVFTNPQQTRRSVRPLLPWRYSVDAWNLHIDVNATSSFISCSFQNSERTCYSKRNKLKSGMNRIRHRGAKIRCYTAFTSVLHVFRFRYRLTSNNSMDIKSRLMQNNKTRHTFHLNIKMGYLSNWSRISKRYLFVILNQLWNHWCELHWYLKQWRRELINMDDFILIHFAAVEIKLKNGRGKNWSACGLKKMKKYDCTKKSKEGRYDEHDITKKLLGNFFLQKPINDETQYCCWLTFYSLNESVLLSEEVACPWKEGRLCKFAINFTVQRKKNDAWRYAAAFYTVHISFWFCAHKYYYVRFGGDEKKQRNE